MSVSCQNETNAPQQGGLSGKVGLWSPEPPHRRCRGNSARLCRSGILAQASGGDPGHSLKTDGHFGSPAARERGRRCFDRRSRSGLFCRRPAKPCIAGAGRWCCRILACCGGGFRDFDRPWSCGTVPVVVGVVAATIAANLLGDRNIWSSVFFAVANAGDAVIIAGLIHRFCGSPFKLNELRRVLALFAATAVATSLSGITGAVGFVLFHGSAASPR
jgi:hypothetical protein